MKRKRGGNTGKLNRHREQKALEAQQRQKARDKRTPEEQLVVLQSRPGNSTKERARLLTSV
jgi:hypothetical protein